MEKKELTRPNRYIKKNEEKEMQPYELGKNQLSLRFKNRAFSILLRKEYYEGTEYGQYYNKRDKNGRSNIYVSQPKLEEKLKFFLKSDGDYIKYLVGYTGTGKTTLIRNYFKIFNKEPQIVDNSLIIYYSFYSMNKLHNNGSNVVWKAYEGTLRKAFVFLSGLSSKEFLLSYNHDFYEKLYEFMEDNNPDLANTYPNTPEYTKKLTPENIYENIIDYISKEKPVEYQLIQLKYFINIYQEKNKEKIDNVVFIFDDIEAQKVIFHEQAIDIAYQIQTCVSAYKNKNFDLKILISLRNYAFRSNQLRRVEAYRVNENEDVILKDEVPALSDVIMKRTNAIIMDSKVIEGIVNISSWETASKNLIHILTKLYGNYDDILIKLTHYNIFKAMQLLLRIITNKKYLGQYEIFGKSGSFAINPSVYPIQNDGTEFFTNNLVFSSLVYGEGIHYIDKENYYLPNILHYSRKDPLHSRILKLYILRYFIVSQNNKKNTLYGVNYEEGKNVTNHIKYIFREADGDFKKYLEENLNKAMSYLYNRGILLQSIYDYDYNDDIRKYRETDKLYLSLRGNQIIDMLNANSLLFEVYRNDIDTDLDNNGTPTVLLKKEESLLYCIKYTEQLFETEKYHINNVSDITSYFTYFSKDFIVAELIRGLSESISIFYQSNPGRFYTVKEALVSLISNINNTADHFRQTKNMTFNKIPTIREGD